MIPTWAYVWVKLDTLDSQVGLTRRPLGINGQIRTSFQFLNNRGLVASRYPWLATVARSVLNDSRVNVIKYSSPKVHSGAPQSPLTTAPTTADNLCLLQHNLICILSPSFVSLIIFCISINTNLLLLTSLHCTSLSSIMQQCSALINSHSYKCYHKNQCDHSPLGILHAFCKT